MKCHFYTCIYIENRTQKYIDIYPITSRCFKFFYQTSARHFFSKESEVSFSLCVCVCFVYEYKSCSHTEGEMRAYYWLIEKKSISLKAKLGKNASVQNQRIQLQRFLLGLLLIVSSNISVCSISSIYAMKRVGTF